MWYDTLVENITKSIHDYIDEKLNSGTNTEYNTLELKVNFIDGTSETYNLLYNNPEG